MWSNIQNRFAVEGVSENATYGFVDARCIACMALQHTSGVNPGRNDSQNSIINFVLKNRLSIMEKIRFLHP